MKHKIWVIVAALVLFAVAVAGVASAFTMERAHQETAQAVAAETATPATGDATAPATVRPGDQGRAVIAKGVVLPAERATLSLSAGGVVAEVLVKEGEQVSAGDVILRLRNERQQAAVAEAEAAVAAARAQLALVQAGARSEAVAAAQAAADGAQARVARLREGARAGDVTAARAGLAAAQAALQRVRQGPDKNLLIAAQADLANAEAAVRTAQAAYDQVKDQPNVGMLPQSLQLEQATNAANAARARYAELTAPPTADRVAQAQAAVQQAQAELDRALSPATAAELAEAQAGLRQAQAQLALVKAGARGEEVAVAEAAVAQAAAGLQQALAALHDTELIAPFAGTLAALHVRTGEQVGPGLPVAELGDMSAWRVETDDLSELDVVQVQAGATVRVTFDALPGLTLTGVVEQIQPRGEKKLGDMTYTVLVRLTDTDPRLLWNMTAVVEVGRE